MPYPTSPPTTLSANLLSCSEFTQLFAPFSPGPPGVWQMSLTPSRLLLPKNLPLSLSLSSAFSKHENWLLIFYMLKSSTLPSPFTHSPSLMLFSPPSFFCSQKANDQLSMQITPFPLVSSKLREPPPPSTPPPAPLLSMSAEVCSLIEMILVLCQLWW